MAHLHSHLAPWAIAIAKRWNYRGVPKPERQPALLKKGVSLLDEFRPSISHKDSLPQQPFDAHLLDLSSLYQRSRKTYKTQKGQFLATLVSSPRTLSSVSLLDSFIEYSPIEREIIWAATDPIESQASTRLMTLRTYSSSLFHEQNHRILWNLVPLAPRSISGLRKYLNFVESLVITLDMALGDQLGPELASLFYLIGIIYDPGTTLRQEITRKRDYRNYLQAALHATYLNLEGYDPEQIAEAIPALFPGLGSFAKRAAIRSSNLDRDFIFKTNVQWQKKHRRILYQRLCGAPDAPVLDLPDHPMDNHQQYLFGEKWFSFMGL